MIKKILIQVFIALFLGNIAFSQGTTGFETLRADVSSRGAGMAGAMIAMDSGEEGLFYNPGALGEVDNHRVRTTYINHILDIEAGFMVYAQRVKNWGTFAIGLDYMNYGEFNVTTTEGVVTEEKFHPNDIVFIIGYGKKIQDWAAIGTNLKCIRSEIYDVYSSAVACDLGGIIYIPTQNIRIGGGIFNLGRTLDGFYDYKDKLPLGYKVGLSRPLEHLPLVVALQLEKYSDSDLYISAGGEFTLSEYFRLRLGWNSRGRDQKMGTDKDFLAGASAGLGFQIGGVIVDFSYASMGELGLLKRLSVGGVF
jgi:hypothetical protein